MSSFIISFVICFVIYGPQCNNLYGTLKDQKLPEDIKYQQEQMLKMLFVLLDH